MGAPQFKHIVKNANLCFFRLSQTLREIHKNKKFMFKTTSVLYFYIHTHSMHFFFHISATVNLTFTYLEHIVKFRNSRKTVRETFRSQIQQRLHENIDFQWIELCVGHFCVHFFRILDVFENIDGLFGRTFLSNCHDQLMGGCRSG